jgi:hypothetical protein
MVMQAAAEGLHSYGKKKGEKTVCSHPSKIQAVWGLYLPLSFT